MGVSTLTEEKDQIPAPVPPKHYDVCGLGNPLVDILINVDDDFLKKNGLNKGIMHLIDKQRKDQLIEQVQDRDKVVEVGGSCPNTIATLALLDTRVGLAGKIGRDYYGKVFEEKIGEKGISSFLKIEDYDTGICTIFITPDKERTMNTYLGACREFRREDLSPDMVRKSRFLYFTGYMWDTKNQKEAVCYAIEIAKSSGVKIVFDIADPFAVERHRKDFRYISGNAADIVVANAQEAGLLYRKQSAADGFLPDAVRYLGDLCELAIVTNGPDDTLISNNGIVCTVPSFKSDVKDTTGAGDNFAAGFLFGLIKGYPVERCGRIASFIASKTIEKIGAQAPFNIKELVNSMD
jgi:sugar/nucleoside kinase (ribokinase family)